jgi:4-alpha-glucanotransferase
MSVRAPRSHRRRLAGVTVPLFSLRTRSSWGIGEIADLPAFARWIGAAGVKLIQLLPLGEINGDDTSPYAALTAFAIDPMYVTIEGLVDLPPDARDRALGADGVLALERVRRSPSVDYKAVRALKQRALRAAFERFSESEAGARTERARDLDAFQAAESMWLADFALYRAVKDALGGSAWFQWPAALRERRPDAIEAARALLADEIRFVVYAQWLARTQWSAARAELERQGFELMGDLPFMVGRDSADVWGNQREFVDTASVGTPPDTFDPEGQDWDLPPYRWETMRDNDFAWLRRRARETGSLFHRFRIDHAVGFYRTFTRPTATRRDARGKLGAGAFSPASEKDQLDHGERVYGAMKDAAGQLGARLVAEDLGTVPDFVRTSLSRLDIPGYRVLVWEKDGAVFRDPRAYPALSVACFGTHDTPPVRIWWETRDAAERAALRALLPSGAAPLDEAYTPAVHETLLDLLNGSGSELTLFLLQDLLGTRDRINTPGTVGPENWSYRLPAPIEDLRDDPEVARWLAVARASIDRGGRSG